MRRELSPSPPRTTTQFQSCFPELAIGMPDAPRSWPGWKPCERTGPPAVDASDALHPVLFPRVNPWICAQTPVVESTMAHLVAKLKTERKGSNIVADRHVDIAVARKQGLPAPPGPTGPSWSQAPSTPVGSPRYSRVVRYWDHAGTGFQRLLAGFLRREDSRRKYRRKRSTLGCYCAADSATTWETAEGLSVAHFRPRPSPRLDARRVPLCAVCYCKRVDSAGGTIWDNNGRGV